MTNHLDAGIPVLTEIIAIPQPVPAAKEAPESGLPASAPSAGASPTPAATQVQEPVQAPKPNAPQQDEDRWRQLELQIRESVLQQMMHRIDFALEQRVRDSLADALQTAVERLSAEIREGLQHSLREVVAHAIEREIHELKSKEK